jgi:hypothetical protein
MSLLLLFRPFGGVGGPPPPVIPPVVAPSGVKRKLFRVRRADFSSQRNYEAALRAALLEANVVTVPGEEPLAKPVREKPAPRIVITDTAIKVSAADMVALQRASEMEELELLELFINVIEDDWEC